MHVSRHAHTHRAHKSAFASELWPEVWVVELGSWDMSPPYAIVNISAS